MTENLKALAEFIQNLKNGNKFNKEDFGKIIEKLDENEKTFFLDNAKAELPDIKDIIESTQKYASYRSTTLKLINKFPEEGEDKQIAAITNLFEREKYQKHTNLNEFLIEEQEKIDSETTALGIAADQLSGYANAITSPEKTGRDR